VLNLHKLKGKTGCEYFSARCGAKIGERMEQNGMEGWALGEGKSMFWLITRKSTRRLKKRFPFIKREFLFNNY